ncbi:hypothetical protein ACFXPA_45220 [Amycolatopsis sp. NPDC059090]
MLSATEEWLDYLGALIARKADEPGDDLLSRLASRSSVQEG